MAKPVINTPQIDHSLESWIYNIKHMLHFPITVLGVAVLLVAGGFAETAPRKSFEFLNNFYGRILFFVFPLIIVSLFDWATGLLCAVVALIFFARLQVKDDEDLEGFTASQSEGFAKLSLNSAKQSEGFAKQSEGFADDLTTEIVPTSKRWFVERILGETPLAISSDRIRRGHTVDDDVRTSSSSSMATSGTSDGSSHK